MTVGIRHGALLKPGRCRGFSLLEVLVAFAILALSLTVLMQVFSTGLRNISVGEDYTRAVLLAESVLASVGVEQSLQEGEQTGAFDDRYGEEYRWRVAVSRYDLAREQEAQEALARKERRTPGAGARGTQRQSALPGQRAQDPFGLQGLGADMQLLVEPYTVVVQVFWGAPDRERSIELTTLRLRPAETAGALQP
jgi:general secretion pathway protein I